MGIREPSRNIRPWVAYEDAKEPEDDQTIRRANRLIGRGQRPITTNK